MTRILQLCLAMILCLGSAWAQDTTQKQQTKPGPPPGAHDRAAMHQQMMSSMQADLDSMKANLEKMKSQVANVKDQSTKDQLQLNIAMWQSLIDNIDKRFQMMKQMGAGAPPMHDHGHGDHEHHGGMATPSPSPKQ